MIGSKKKKMVPKKVTPPPRAKAPALFKKEGEQAPKEEKRRGRPPGSKSGSTGPAGEKAIREKRKRPDDIKDTRSAIARYHEDMRKLVERYKKEHPGALVAIPSDPFAAAVREKIPSGVFIDMLKGMTLPIYVGMDTLSAFPQDEQFGAAGKLWEETSAHFEMSRWIVLSAAVVTTIGLVLPAVATRLVQGADHADGKITVRPVDPADGSPNA
jgi:hypothetical protein